MGGIVSSSAAKNPEKPKPHEAYTIEQTGDLKPIPQQVEEKQKEPEKPHQETPEAKQKTPASEQETTQPKRDKLESNRLSLEHSLASKLLTNPLLKKHFRVLRKGGHWCKLGDAVMQFGCPPETIKDSMAMGLDVPMYLVILGDLFSRTKGINFAEVEFPAYFNFFIRRRKTVIVTTESIENRIRTLFKETLLGPDNTEETIAQDFKEGTTPDHFPRFKQEGEYLDAARKVLQVDSLLEFKIFQPATRTDDFVSSLSAKIDEDIIIDYFIDNREYAISSKKHVGDEPLTVRMHDIIYGMEGEIQEKYFMSAELTERSLQELPTLGVTMLGTSHGFDPNGQTTGFVLWCNRRGTMVDPPPQALECLDKLGISSRMIDSIILTHCHSDHDTGTFRKLLFDQHIAVYTTKTIFNSFLRKYSAVTGFSKDFLSKLLVFKPALIGQDHFIHGGKFNFFYSLHTIPCVGFTVELDGKKIAYSADTHNSQELFDKMYKDNVIGKGRMEQLGSFNWDADVILHEAGVPPIHTPMQNLVTLPENVKKNLYVVHVAKKDVPKDCGLSTVEQGETISIPTKVSDLNASIEVLDVLKSVDIFREVCQTFPDAVEILYLISQEEFKPGERIVKAGDPGGKFYIITKGTAIVSWEFNGVKKHKQFYVGDYFGETSIVTGAPRNADVHAICHVRAASISTQHFEHLIAGTGIRDKLLALANVRNADSWHLIMKNSITRSLTSTAKTHLEFIMQSHRFEKDEVVWDIGDPAMFVLMIQTGKFHIECCKTTLRTREINISIFIDDHGALQICNGLLPDVAPHNQLNVRTQDVGFRIDGLKTEGSVTTGAILSDFDAIYTEHAVASRVVCQEEGIAFKISSSDWKKFCSHFPGAFVFFLNRHMAE